MAAFIRKDLTFFIVKHASNKNVPSPLSLSLPLRFFSTPTQTHLDINTNSAVYDILVHKHDFPSAFASGIASKLSHLKNPETVDSMLTFLKSIGFSNAQLQKIPKCSPRYFCYNVEDNIKPKIKSFQEEGFSSGDISQIISSCPVILGMRLNNNILPSFSVLKGLLGSKTAFISALRKSPRLLTMNIERTVVVNVEFLKSVGISMDQIRIIFCSHPSTFRSKPEVIRGAVEKAKEMGLTPSSKTFIYAIPPIASMTNESWELKLQALREMGYSESDILSMFRKEPRVFIVSIAKMKKITEGLLATGKFDISSIVQFPLALMFSFEKRYEPRMRVLRNLESRNLIQNWPSLYVLSSSSVGVFSKRYVRPYMNEVVDVGMKEMND